MAETFVTKNWAMKIAHEGRRETFPLGAPNKAAAAGNRLARLALQYAGYSSASLCIRIRRARSLTQIRRRLVARIQIFSEAFSFFVAQPVCPVRGRAQDLEWTGAIDL
jgi:hypothetical protein